MNKRIYKIFSWENLWDLFLTLSIVGIWPRFIEPNVISTTKLSLPVPHLPERLENLHLVQISDLHLNKKVSDRYLKRLSQKINKLDPDILLFTGDLLCYSKLQDRERLIKFLNSLNARYGSFAILGNHDYEEPVSINASGEYDLSPPAKNLIKKGLSLLFNQTILKKRVTKRAKMVPPHPELLRLWKETPFTLLHNHTETLLIKGYPFNITGLGEYTLGRALPEQAFENYNPKAPGVILTHNPDSVPLIEDKPGGLILAGHTHGAQINLPFIWKRFTAMENPIYKRGLFSLKSKWLYVTRGLGSVVPFRIGSIPEIVSIKLSRKHDE